MKDVIKKFFNSKWTMSEKVLLVADVFLFGVLLGWLTSPLREGIHVFSDNVWDINTEAVCEEDEEADE